MPPPDPEQSSDEGDEGDEPAARSDGDPFGAELAGGLDFDLGA